MRCPTCHNDFEEADTSAMPFCSDRCRLIDLGRWLDEVQVLPTWNVPDEEDEEQPGDLPD